MRQVDGACDGAGPPEPIGGDGMMTGTTGTAGTPEQAGRHERPVPQAPQTGPWAQPATGGFPAPRQHPTGPRHAVAPTPSAPRSLPPTPVPYAAAWDPALDEDDPRPAGNAAASVSAVLGFLALLVSLRPLAFGSMTMAWDTYVALAVAVLALVLAAVGLRTPVRRVVAVVGMALSLATLVVVALLPTL
jgi:hypothetical protein